MGVEKTVLRPGNGSDKPKSGDEIILEYVGYIYDQASGSRGKECDSSDRRGEFTTVIGTGKVIDGFDEGILNTDGGMTLGEKATLIITSDLAYGKVGFPGRIPSDSSLIFDIELIAINGKRA